MEQRKSAQQWVRALGALRSRVRPSRPQAGHTIEQGLAPSRGSCGKAKMSGQKEPDQIISLNGNLNSSSSSMILTARLLQVNAFPARLLLPRHGRRRAPVQVQLLWRSLGAVGGSLIRLAAQQGGRREAAATIDTAALAGGGGGGDGGRIGSASRESQSVCIAYGIVVSRRLLRLHAALPRLLHRRLGAPHRLAGVLALVEHAVLLLHVRLTATASRLAKTQWIALLLSPALAAAAR